MSYSNISPVFLAQVVRTVLWNPRKLGHRVNGPHRGVRRGADVRGRDGPSIAASELSQSDGTNHNEPKTQLNDVPRPREHTSDEARCCRPTCTGADGMGRGTRGHQWSGPHRASGGAIRLEAKSSTTALTQSGAPRTPDTGAVPRPIGAGLCHKRALVLACRTC
jgi:hypothetical protein